MIVLNFSHPIKTEQLKEMELLTNQKVDTLQDISIRLDNDLPFWKQVDDVISMVGYSSQEWQTNTFLIVLPSHSVIAAIVLSELHGRIGYFPCIIRQKPVSKEGPQRFEIAEIVDLQNIRNQARQTRNSFPKS